MKSGIARAALYTVAVLIAEVRRSKDMFRFCGGRDRAMVGGIGSLRRSGYTAQDLALPLLLSAGTKPCGSFKEHEHGVELERS